MDTNKNPCGFWVSPHKALEFTLEGAFNFVKSQVSSFN